MVKQIVTRLAVVTKTGRRKGSIYRSPRIYLPTKLTDDSTFPFSGGELVKVEIMKGCLVVSRAKAVGGRGRQKVRKSRSARS